MITDSLDLDDVLDDTGQIAPPRVGRPKVTAARDRQKQTTHALFEPTSASSASWWLGLSPEAFTQQVPLEQARMQQSKFGKMKGNIPESPA